MHVSEHEFSRGEEQSGSAVIWAYPASELAKVRVMAKVEAPRPFQEDPDECLHCEIIDMVDERIAAGGADAAELVTLVAESLVDLILRVPADEQASLMAHTLSALGDLFLQKREADGEHSGSTH